MSFLDTGRIGLTQIIVDALRSAPRLALVGFGLGNPDWDGDGAPPVSRESTALVAPVAYVSAYAIDYAKLRSEVVSPGPLPVVVDGVEYEPVTTPSPLLLIRALLPLTFASANGRLLREVGLSLKPTFAGGVGLQQTRFLPAEIADTGRMVEIRRFTALPHDGSNSGLAAAFLVEL